MIMTSEPYNKPDPQTAIGDTVLGFGEVFLMCVPYDMSVEAGIDPSTWTTTSPGTSPFHPCVIIMNTVSGLMIELEIFILRSFRGREPREITEKSSNANEISCFPF